MVKWLNLNGLRANLILNQKDDINMKDDSNCLMRWEAVDCGFCTKKLKGIFKKNSYQKYESVTCKEYPEGVDDAIFNRQVECLLFDSIILKESKENKVGYKHCWNGDFVDAETGKVIKLVSEVR